MQEKHAIDIKGHRTSVSLEREFWQILKEIAKKQQVSLRSLVERIDEEREPKSNLSSNIRVFVVKELRRLLKNW